MEENYEVTVVEEVSDERRKPTVGEVGIGAAAIGLAGLGVWKGIELSKKVVNGIKDKVNKGKEVVAEKKQEKTQKKQKKTEETE